MTWEGQWARPFKSIYREECMGQGTRGGLIYLGNVHRFRVTMDLTLA